MGNEQQRLSPGVFSVIGNGSEWESEVALGKMHLVRNRLSKQRGQAYSTSWSNPSKQVMLYQMRHSRCKYVVQVYAVLPQETDILGTSQKITVITERIPFRLTDIAILTYPEALYMLKCVLEAARCIAQFVKGVVYGEEMICINGEGKCKLWVNECIATNDCRQDERQNEVRALMELIEIKMGDKYNYSKTRLMDNPKTIEQNIVFVEKLIAQFPEKIERIEIKMSNPESQFQSSFVSSSKKLDEERSSSRLLRPQEYDLPKTSKLPPRPKKRSAEKSLTCRKSSGKEKEVNSLIKSPSNVQQPSTMSFIANSPSLAKPIVSLRSNPLDSSPKITEQKTGCFRPSPQQLSPFEIYKLKAMGQTGRETITRNHSPQYYPSSANVQFALPKDMSPRDNILSSNSTQALPRNPLLNIYTAKNKRIENNPVRFTHIPSSSQVFESSNSNIVSGGIVYGTGLVSFNRPF